MPDVAEPLRPTTPPSFLFHDRRHVDRRRGPRRVDVADIPAERRAASDRRDADRRQGPDEHLWDALVMLDDLTQRAETGSDSSRVIAGAARRMWLALAEFRRESGEHTLDTWLAERKAS